MCGLGLALGLRRGHKNIILSIFPTKEDLAIFLVHMHATLSLRRMIDYGEGIMCSRLAYSV